jgi:protein-S-isoprenylcysteine O-methyltransferase Ste14
MLIELILILARCTPNSPLSQAIFSRLPASTLAGLASVRVTRDFVAGAALTTAGALIRLATYKEMGKLFTFHLTIRGDAHKLITSGIYSVVRHPSYTGYWILASGATLMSFGRGSVFRECGWLSTPAGRVFCACYLFERISQSLHLVWRAQHEDEFLKKQFGEDWLAWARRTPCKFVPYVW